MKKTFEMDFIQAIKESGLEPPDKIVVDGQFNRFSSEGRPSDKSGWYVLSDLSDGVIAGAFGCWRSIDKVKWSSVKMSTLSKEKQRQVKKTIRDAIQKAERERKVLQEKASKEAESLWEKAKPADQAHPYLSKKKVSPFDLKQNMRDGKDVLLVPLRDLDGKLWSMQRIYPDGNKLFLKDGRTSGLMHTLGEPTPTRIIAEGFSTGASIHEATGHCVHIAFNCHNLKSVAESIRKAHPDTDLIIAADDDWKTEGNPGMTKATEAAMSYGAKLAIPSWLENQRNEKETDFNDLALSHGSAQVKTCINRATPQEKEEESAEGLQASIKCLSKLNPPEYDLIRKEEAKKLGIRTSTLDKEVAKLRKKQATEDESFEIPIDPWPDAVNGEQLLDEIHRILSCHVVAKQEVLETATLWSAFTWFIDVVRVSPIAIITSPEKRCGKTNLSNVMRKFCLRPLSASNITSSALFRSIEKWNPTLLLDETDSFMKDKEDLRGLLNSGHTRDNAFIIRCTGDDHEPTRFNTFGAKLLAGIGDLPETVMDRGVILKLRRKLQGEHVERLRNTPAARFEEFRRKLKRFAEDHSKTIANANPVIPSSLNDREQDNWEPLLAIAEAAGGHWPETARHAAVALSQNGDEQSSNAIKLLSDIRQIFSKIENERISTVELIEALCSDEERPWSTFKQGAKITARQVANMLHGFDIKSKSIRIYGRVIKGYELQDFEDSFQRYLVSDPHKEGLQVTNTCNASETVTLACNGSEDVTVTNADPLHQTPCKHSHVTCNSKNPTPEQVHLTQPVDDVEIF